MLDVVPVEGLLKVLLAVLGEAVDRNVPVLTLLFGRSVDGFLVIRGISATTFLGVCCTVLFLESFTTPREEDALDLSLDIFVAVRFPLNSVPICVLAWISCSLM